MRYMKTTLFFFTLFTFFSLSAQTPTPPPSEIVPSGSKVVYDNNIVDFPDVETEFKGGADAMQKFINKHVKYPQEAIEQNIQGRVYLSFVVDAKGRIRDVEVDRGVHPSLDDAAVDVIEAMPKWKPGEMNGKKVATRVRVPINFTLN